jgi:uncharacterized repeat protein (TIGR03987 family)
MSNSLLFAIIFINLAMVLYTVGVWAERIQHRLKWWHLFFFWAGLVCDTIGTGAMSEVGGALFKFNFHGITGMTAIRLMMIHASWATWVLLKKDEKRILTFHTFSIFVWIIWMIPMIGGMVMGASV